MRRFLTVLPPLALAALTGCGTDVSGPAASLFSCILTEPTTLAAGEVVHVRGASNRGLCLAADGAGAEYVYIPFHGAAEGEAGLDLVLTAAGVVDVVGPPTPSPLPGAPVALRSAAGAVGAPRLVPGGDRLHRTLREWERVEGSRRLLDGPAVPMARAAADPEVGDLVSYNVAVSCSVEDNRMGRVEYVSDRAVVVADVQNPVALLPTDYIHFGETFDTLVDPVSVAHFGEPTDIDANGRAVIFFTRAVNELNPPGVDVFTAGFFWSGDLFPEEATARAEACPGGNQAEMFYMLTADPAGEAGRQFSAAEIRELTIPVIAHEYQHLINAGRRLWVNEASAFEAVWLNEGLSHVAEELLYFAVTGLGPGADIGYDEVTGAPGGAAAFNDYMGGNFDKYFRFLERPDTVSILVGDNLPTRGAAWNFLRYAADRSGRGDEAFFGDVVNGTTAGLDNLRRVLGAEPLDWMRDWAVSVYADDAVPVAAAYTQPTWNFRDLFVNSTLGRFPLRVFPLEADEAIALGLGQGGTAFPRFGIAPDGVAVLDVGAESGAPPSSLRGSYLRTR